MSWLDDLIGVTPSDGGFEDYLAAPSFDWLQPGLESLQRGGLELSKLLTPYQYEPQTPQEMLKSGRAGLQDIYHGVMAPLSAGKETIDALGGLAADQLDIPVHGGNEAGQLAWLAAKTFDPTMRLLVNPVEQMGGGKFINTAGENVGGMATDPMMYLMPNSKALGLAFVPGAFEQILGGLQQGGQEGAANALTGGALLTGIGLAHAPEFTKGYLHDLTHGIGAKEAPKIDVNALLDEGMPSVIRSQADRAYNERAGIAGTNEVRGLTMNQIPDGLPGMDSRTGEKFIFANGTKYFLPEIGREGIFGNQEGSFTFGKNPEIPKLDLEKMAGDIVDQALNQSMPKEEIPLREKLTPEEKAAEDLMAAPFEGKDVEKLPISAGDLPENLGKRANLAWDSASSALDSLRKVGDEVNNLDGVKNLEYAINNKDHALASDFIMQIVDQLDKIGGKKANALIDQLMSAGEDISNSLIERAGNLSGGEKNLIEASVPKAEPDTTSLNSHVQAMKEKYGNSWRKNMSDAESAQFDNLLNETMGLKGEKTVPPAEPPSEPPAPKEPPPILKRTSNIERALLPAEEVIKRASPEISKAEQSYRQEYESNASKQMAIVEGAKREIPDAARRQAIGKYLDGQQVVLTPKEKIVADKLRAAYDETLGRGVAHGLLEKGRKDYFTHMNEKLSSSSSVYTGKEGLGEKPFGYLERPRTSKGSKINYDFAEVMPAYFKGAERRIAEAKYLGKNLEVVNPKGFRTESAPVGSKEYQQAQDTRKFVENYIRRVTGREPAPGPVARLGTKLRKWSALSDLSKAALNQVGQASQTAAHAGMRNSIRAAYRTFKNFKGEELQAMAHGSLWPNISHEVSKVYGSNNYMHGIPTVDKALRVHADVASGLLLQDAKNGNKFALRQLEAFGLSPNDPPAKVAKIFTDKTQFRTDTPYLPLWAHTEAGKFMTQYMPFAYRQTVFAHDLLKHPIQNRGAIARFAIMGALIGEGIGDSKAAINSIIPGKGKDDEIGKRVLQAAVDRAPIKLDNPKEFVKSAAWRAISNASLVGGVGIFQNLIDKITGRDPKRPADYINTLAGPTLGKVGDTAENLRRDIINEDFTFPKTGKSLIVNAPSIPLLGNRGIANYLYPPKGRRGNNFVELPKIDYPDVEFPSF